MHEVLVNRLGGLSLPKKSMVRITDRPDMTLDVYRRRKTTLQQQRFTVYVYTSIPFSFEGRIWDLLCWSLDIVYLCFYAPNFEEVEGAYWFGPVRPSVRLSVSPSVRLSVCLSVTLFGSSETQEPLMLES